jgi:hypothetical protein
VTDTQAPPSRPPLFAALPPEVSIYEVGPRDGLQNESTILPPTARSSWSRAWSTPASAASS